MEWIVPEVAKVGPVMYMLVAGAATLLVGISKGGFGGGVGVLATPLFLMILPSHTALSLILPLLIVCDLFTLRHFPRDWDPRSYSLIAPGTLLGLGIGLNLLLYFGREEVDGDRWIRLVVSVVSLTFCGLRAWRAVRKEKVSSFTPGPVVGTVTGILCGITTMVAHAAGVLVGMFLIAQRLEPKKFVGTCARYYLTFNTTKVPLYLIAGFLAEKSYITFDTLKWDLWLVPLCPIGVGIGAWLNSRMSGKAFTVIIYVLLAITGVKMLMSSL